MSMSTRVVGFVPPDDTWCKMRAVHDACAAAGIDAPDEVEDFFGGEEPDPSGQTVELGPTTGVRPWESEGRAGFEVVVSELPGNVKVIRFFNSW